MLRRIAQTLKQHVSVELMDGEVSEEALVQKIAEKSPLLFLVPWYRALQWRKVEATLFGMKPRSPLLAGYAADSLHPHEIAEVPSTSRPVLLDFNRSTQSECVQIILALLKEESRVGLRPLLKPDTPIHFESWNSGESLSDRTELFSFLSGLKETSWARRAVSIRQAVLAFWSLAYEYGPTRGPSAQVQFQIGFDEQAFAVRLLATFPGYTAKSGSKLFWPGQETPEHPAQWLLRSVDFLRIHPSTEGSQIEITALFWPSAPASQAPEEIHTLWIEPVHPKLLGLQNEGTVSPLKHQDKTKTKNSSRVHSSPARERRLAELQGQIRDLLRLIQEKEEQLFELKSGGLGVSQSFAPPDGETLIFALKERCKDLSTQIQTAESNLQTVLGQEPSSTELRKIQKQIDTLTAKEKLWVRGIGTVVEQLKRKKAG